MGGNTTILSDLPATGPGITQSLGTLTMSGNTLTIAAGGSVSDGTPAVAFSAGTITAAATLNPTTADLHIGSIYGTTKT